MQTSHEMPGATPRKNLSGRRIFFRMATGALLFTALIGFATANAQPTFGALTGVIKDSANVPLAGATITAARHDGGTVQGTISNSQGIYSFSDLTPGNYSVTA